MSEYLTTDESVQLLGVSPRTLRRYVTRGLLSKITEKGRVLYPRKELEVIQQTSTRRGALSIVEDRVSSMSAKMIALETRVRILELALSSRQPNVTLTDDELTLMRRAIKNTTRRERVTFQEVSAWADDLLRLDRDTCAKLSFKKLQALVTRLLVAGEASADTYLTPSRVIVLDKLRVFELRLQGYARVTPAPSEARSRQGEGRESSTQ